MRRILLALAIIISGQDELKRRDLLDAPTP
jgi:hypothetical protein